MELNPNSTIPMLTQGNTKVIGDGPAMFNYLVNSTECVAEHFSHEAQAKKVKEFMQYFMRSVRRISAKLIQAIINPKILG